MRLRNLALIVTIVSIIIQIVLVSNYSGKQIGDGLTYFKSAESSIHNRTFYPGVHSLHELFLAAPGYVNFMILLLLIFGSIKAVLYANIFLNIIIVSEIYLIAKKIYNEKVALISVIVFGFYLTNYGIILYSISELLFTALALGAIYFYLRKSTLFILLAGILAALSNWARPFLPVLFVVILAMTVWIHKENRMKKLAIFSSGLLVTILLIGFSSYNSSGHFIYQSVPGGNILVGANDDADGGHDDIVFQEGKIGYIKDRHKLTSIERSEFYMVQAKKWIKDNPGKYILLIPRKLFYMYAHDLHSLAALGEDVNVKVHARPYIESLIKQIRENPLSLSFFQILLIFHQAFYMVLLIFSIIGLLVTVKKKIMPAIAVSLFWVLGTGATVLVVGGSRYHHPYMGIVIILSAFALNEIFRNYKKKRQIIKLAKQS